MGQDRDGLGLETVSRPNFQTSRSRLGLEEFLEGLVSVSSRTENPKVSVSSRSRALRSRLQARFLALGKVGFPGRPILFVCCQLTVVSYCFSLAESIKSSQLNQIHVDSISTSQELYYSSQDDMRKLLTEYHQ